MDGAVVVYDAQTLKGIKRLPMKKPSGKYSVYNKITGSEGASCHPGRSAACAPDCRQPPPEKGCCQFCPRPHALL